VLLATALALLAAEMGFRALRPLLGIDPGHLDATRRILAGETPPGFRPHPHTVFGLEPGHEGINVLGFPGEELVVAREPGRLRIACLGASTTMSGNAEGPGASYPFLLGETLRKAGGDVEVLNFGTPAWTTAETLVNYLLLGQDYAPDVVVIHHAVNDLEPRWWPDYRSDSFHFRQPWTRAVRSEIVQAVTGASDLVAYLFWRKLRRWDVRNLVTRNRLRVLASPDFTLEPDTARGFRRNVRTLCSVVLAGGGIPVLTTMPYQRALARRHPEIGLGIDDHNRILRAIARDEGILLVDWMETFLELPLEADEAYFVDIVHCTRAGNRLKAESLAGALLASGALGGD
jgi:lysophospholipase L1-like esterase